MDTNQIQGVHGAEGVGAPSIPLPKKPRKKREGRKLTWNERQYGAGFINGVWCGIAVGFPLAAGVAALCKVFVGWLMAW